MAIDPMIDPCIIALDLGTSGCKALALSRTGRIMGKTYRAITTSRPAADRFEQAADEVWRAAAAALRELTAGVPVDRIAGVAMSGAMHTLMPIGDDDQPLAPASTWADQRGGEMLDTLRREADFDALYARTGCPLLPLYHPPRLRWWAKFEPRVFERAARFVGLTDFVVHRLTGTWAMNTSLAAATGLLDVRSATWHGPSLKLAGFDASRLPPLVDARAVVGRVTHAAASATGLPPGLPVAAGASDGALANLGAGGDDGSIVMTIGTSAAVRRLADAPRFDPQRRTWCYLLHEGRYLNGCALNNGGMALTTIADRYFDDLPQLFSAAAGVAPGADGAIVVPFFTPERGVPFSPMIQPHAPEGFDRAHIARAAVEGLAMSLAIAVRTLAPQRPVDAPLRLTGGVTKSPLMAQILADVLGSPLQLVDAADASAIGAAIIGHMALKHIVRPAEVPLLDATGAFVEPDPATRGVYEARLAQFRELCGM
ncbi:MAG: hypothetical protein GC162_15700 [Planctomycetes bacterium]|nr:hypothetical protein [Planctomycetota bacterium]